MTAGVRIGSCLVAAAITGGCAARGPQSLSERFVHRASTSEVNAPARSDRATPESIAQREALAAAIARMRQASAALPARTTGAQTLEDQDPELAAARAELALAPSARHHHRVAQAYARLRVFDAAYDHFSAALQLDKKDAFSYDGRARVWREWGFASFGLSDAYHAIYYAPASPVPQNTLGTLFLKMGLRGEARGAFQRALTLDPKADYALDNLCRLSRARGDAVPSLEACSPGRRPLSRRLHPPFCTRWLRRPRPKSDCRKSSSLSWC